MPKKSNGSDRSDKPYAIGYCKPPRGKPFEKGCPSPNPKGRPKHSNDLSEVIVRVGNEKILIPIKGVDKKRPLIEALAKRIFQDGMRDSNWRAWDFIAKAYLEMWRRSQLTPESCGEPEVITFTLKLEEDGRGPDLP